MTDMTPNNDLIRTDYTIFRYDGSEETGVIFWPKEPSLDQLNKLLCPILECPRNYLENVRVLYNGFGRDMIVHEEGHVVGLPRNDKATDIYRAFWLKEHPETEPESLAWIAGNAVLFNRRVWC